MYAQADYCKKRKAVDYKLSVVQRNARVCALPAETGVVLRINEISVYSCNLLVLINSGSDMNINDNN